MWGWLQTAPKALNIMKRRRSSREKMTVNHKKKREVDDGCFDSGRKVTGGSYGNTSSIRSCRPMEAPLRSLDVFLETLGAIKCAKQQSFMRKVLSN